MSRESKPSIRFRVGSYGMEVFIAGKWVPADDRVQENIVNILSGMYPEGR